jgi:hypothetical protein
VKESTRETPVGIAPPPRLSFIPLRDTGLAAFLDAIGEVNARTLDRYDLWSARDGGNLRHAEEMFAALSDIDRDEGLWHLAFDGEGLAGCLVPQRLDEETGMVNYFGVVPGAAAATARFRAKAVSLLEAVGMRYHLRPRRRERADDRILERAGFTQLRAHVFKAEALTCRDRRGSRPNLIEKPGALQDGATQPGGNLRSARSSCPSTPRCSETRSATPRASPRRRAPNWSASMSSTRRS